jgi:hypothetical protein
MALPTTLLLPLPLPHHSLLLLQEFFSSKKSFARIYKTQLTSFFPF